MSGQGPSLTLAQTQQLQMVLAPQLRQSLEMLQLPILELSTMVQQELEQNPTLEEGPSETPAVEVETHSDIGEDDKELSFEKEYEVLAKLDDEWREYFFQDVESRPYSKEDEEKRSFFMDSIPEKESLQEHLLKQLRLAAMSETDHQIGELIIGSISNDGYLTAKPEELAESGGCDLEHLKDILAVIQDFHPTGVGAQDLAECLLIQLDRLGKGDTLASQIVRNHLDLLGAKKISEIAKALDASVEQVQDAAKIIGTLDPKPGSTFGGDVATYILPEVIVEKSNGEYVVILNDDQLPHVRISNFYRRMLKESSTTSDVKSYIRERIRSAVFLIRSIHQRQSTIFRIASEIVSAQTEFLDHGVSHLKPLTMAQIAGSVGVHETTVSRAVSGKYMTTPTGIFEMKYFFSPGIKTASGSLVSNKTVRDMIAKIVEGENSAQPLSDHEIVAKLEEQGIHVARRTVAKYRLLLRIAPSHLRKKQ